ncbi:MAG: IS5/IS1182 family transposase, partial [Betaproteobacteria bacterium]|nr:IS5/IS1182 family transposase [Betaproteobacteria bacterium]
MADAYQRHDISDAAWVLLEPRLPGRKGVWGGIA